MSAPPSAPSPTITPPPADHSTHHGDSAPIVSTDSTPRCHHRGTGKLRNQKLAGVRHSASIVGAEIDSHATHSSAPTSGARAPATTVVASRPLPPNSMPAPASSPP
jgi:hypothetical protein